MLKLAEYTRPEVRYQLLFLFPLLVEQKDFQKIVSSNVVLRPLSYSSWQVGGGVWHAVYTADSVRFKLFIEVFENFKILPGGNCYGNFRWFKDLS